MDNCACAHLIFDIIIIAVHAFIYYVISTTNIKEKYKESIINIIIDNSIHMYT